MEILAFLNWETIATFSGAVGLTVLIVQLLKLPIDKVGKIPTRYLVYVVCFAIMLLAQVFLGNSFSLALVALTAINAVVGSMTAMSVYEIAIAKPEEQRLQATYKYMMTGKMDTTEETEGGSSEATPSAETTEDGSTPETET